MKKGEERGIRVIPNMLYRKSGMSESPVVHGELRSKEKSERNYLFVVTACHQLDGFNQVFQATVHFPLIRTFD